jgi:hypothetical protein
LGAGAEECIIIKQSQSQVCSVVRGSQKWWPQVIWQLVVSGFVRWGLITIRIRITWKVVFVSCLVLSGFQDGCKVSAGKDGSEQRLQIQNGGQVAKLLSCLLCPK